jgi:DNA-binding Lrp family transcriptional regulator
VAVAPDSDSARSWAAALRERPEVRAVTTTDALVPADQDEKLALLEDLSLLMGADFGAIERTPAEPAATAAALAALEAASAGKPDARALHDATAELRQRLAAGSEGDRNAALRRQSALIAGLARVLVAVQVGAGQLDSVAKKVREVESFSEAYSTSGEYDLLVKLYIENLDELGRLIERDLHSIAHIRETFTILTFEAFGRK